MITKPYLIIKKNIKLGYNSHKQPLKGLRELITREIIATHIVNNIYWLNPAIVCKGERFAKYTEYIVGKDGEEIKQQAMIKEQNRNLIEIMPEQAFHKIQKSNQQPSIDGGLFPNENPYNQ